MLTDEKLDQIIGNVLRRRCAALSFVIVATESFMFLLLASRRHAAFRAFQRSSGLQTLVRFGNLSPGSIAEESFNSVWSFS
jgi:hypothetical protein